MSRVVDFVCLEGSFVGRPAGIDALVHLGVVKQQGSFDLLGVLCGGLATVKGSRCFDDVGKPNRQRVGHASAEAESHDADGTIAISMLLEEASRRDEVFGNLVAIELALHGPAFVVIAGIASQRSEGIGAEGDESGDSSPSHDILNVGIQTTVLMNDENARQLS